MALPFVYMYPRTSLAKMIQSPHEIPYQSLPHEHRNPSHPVQMSILRVLFSFQKLEISV